MYCVAIPLKISQRLSGQGRGERGEVPSLAELPVIIKRGMEFGSEVYAIVNGEGKEKEGGG